jgi:hypothetical protein
LPILRGGRTCLGFKTFSIRAVALVSTSALSEAGRGFFGFFWGLILQGWRGLAIVVITPVAIKWIVRSESEFNSRSRPLLMMASATSS